MSSKSLLLIAILIVSPIIFAVPPNVMAAQTLYVGSSTAVCNLPPGSTVYSTVSSAVTAAGNGDTILLCENIIENVGLLVIDKTLTITGAFQGNINQWIVRDTSNLEPILRLIAPLTFESIVVDVGVSAGTAFGILIDVRSTELTLNNSVLIGSLATSQAATLIKATGFSNITFKNSNVTFPVATDPASITRVVFLENSNFYMNPSRVENRGNGTAVYAELDGASYPDYMIDVINSTIISRYFHGLQVKTTNSSNVELLFEGSSFVAEENAVFLDGNSTSRFTVDILNSSLDGDDVAFNVDLNFANLYVFSNPSSFDGRWDSIHLDGSNKANITFEGYNLDIYGRHDAIQVDLDGDSSLYLGLFDSSVYADHDEAFDLWFEGSDVFIDIMGGDIFAEEETFQMDLELYTTVEMILQNSIAESHDEELFDVDISGFSSWDLDILSSDLYSEEETLDLFIGDSFITNTPGFADIFVSGSNLYSDDNDEVDIFTDHPNSDVYALFEYSRVHDLDVWGDGNIFVEVYESYVDEIDSYNGGHDVYMEWTLAIYVLGKPTMSPIAGAMVNAYLNGILIDSTFTSGAGLALITFSYWFDSSNEFIEQLELEATFKGQSNRTPYTAFDARHTIPSWYGNVTILLEVLIISANVAGHIGFGTLFLASVGGVLTIGAATPGGWMNTYPVMVNGVSYVGNFLIVDIMVLYNGNWVGGYVFANTDSRTLYMRFGGVELYGSF